MNIRYYQDNDYPALVELYKTSQDFLFDEETDAQERLATKISRDPESILVAIENDHIIGSVSIIEDGRIALLFRFVVHQSVTDSSAVMKALMNESERILSQRSYKEVHTTIPMENASSIQGRIDLGFIQGKNYSWFWKKI